MKRSYKKQSTFDTKRLGAIFFTLFIVFVAFKILTPPNHEIMRLNAPDGSKIARLRKFYYVSQPSYKIDYREADKLIWLNLLNLPSYTNVPHATARESIQWSADSKQLYLKINDTNLWMYRFSK